MSDFAEIAVLLLVILNPFALAVYLIDLFRSLRLGEVFAVLARAVAIGGVVFSIFAWSGQKVFTDVLQIRFAAFQVFGGIVFLVMALRFMLTGSQTLVALRGSPGHVAGAIAMPARAPGARASGICRRRAARRPAACRPPSRPPAPPAR
jgi:small neutral amino acid transporter SnatA (MarC family)